MVEKLFPPSYEFDTAVISKAKDVLQKRYLNEIEQGHIQYDPAQEVVLQLLQEHLENVLLCAGEESKRGWRKLIFSKQQECNSLYIYGGVGCGKSMLMDLFFEACPIKQKRRIHFHAFMQEVHQFNHQWRQQYHGSPIPELAKKNKEIHAAFMF